jgi:hypothetical protein
MFSRRRLGMPGEGEAAQCLEIAFQGEGERIADNMDGSAE